MGVKKVEIMIRKAHKHLLNEWKTRTRQRHLAIRGINFLDEIIAEAIKRAHSPSVNRALNTFGIPTRAPREKAAMYLQTEIKKLLKNNEIDENKFDQWIEKACKQIKQYYHEANITDYTLGNAQKLVNMTIKFIFSSDRINYNLKIFKVCHLPIDRVIMNKAKQKLNIQRLEQTWPRTDDWDAIINYQNKIRKAVSLEKEKYPLVWECLNW